MTTPPPNLDLSILYSLIARVDEKLDQLMDRFVPRPEIEARFEASVKDRGELKARLDSLELRRKADLQWAVYIFVAVLSATAAVVGLILR